MPTLGQGRSRVLALALVAFAGSSASAQLRIADWNISNYSSGRITEFQTSIYGSYQGRSMSPDALICQEFLSAAAVTNFLSILNTAPGSPGDWAAAPFIDGNDTDNSFFYRTSRVQFLGVTIASTGASGLSNHPRNVARYDIRPSGYAAASTTIACYSSHMKAGSTTDDQAQRLIEANGIRANSGALPAGWNYLLAGDFNIQSSTQDAWVTLANSVPAAGRFVDPIKTPGTWNNANAFRFVHTQSPGGTDPTVTGGMDDRFDCILLSPSLVDGTGFDYIGNPNIAYSTTTWNDPNHSFRCWGNDGSSFNQTLTIASNAMVGPTIAQALHDAPGADGSGGHLPVFMDLRVPPRLSSPSSVNFGQVAQNSPAQLGLALSNGGDIAKWSAAGIATLTYSLTASAGLSAPGGSFNSAAGATPNTHTITINTSVVGPFSGTVTVTSNSPEEPTKVITITGEIVGTTCYANCDQSTTAPVLNSNDFACFLNAFAGGQSYANCDNSSVAPILNANDFGCFLNAFAQGCP